MRARGTGLKKTKDAKAEPIQDISACVRERHYERERHCKRGRERAKITLYEEEKRVLVGGGRG